MVTSPADGKAHAVHRFQSTERPFDQTTAGSSGVPVHFVMFSAPVCGDEDDVLVADADLARDVDAGLVAEAHARAAGACVLPRTR